MSNRSVDQISDIEKEKQTLKRKPSQNGLKVNNNEENHSLLNNHNVEVIPDNWTSILTSQELSHSANASQKTNFIKNLHNTHGNSYLQKIIQAKLKISQPGDVYEKEADRIADIVVNIQEPDTLNKLEFNGKKQNQLKPFFDQASLLIQRQVGEEGIEEDKEMFFTKSKNNNPIQESQDIGDSFKVMYDKGNPLPDSVRSLMEPRFGCDFSDVRIHNDPKAEESARALNAHAFTMGKNIFFGTNQYQVGTNEGRRLLAHELTHVLQQNSKLHFSRIQTKSAKEKTYIVQKGDRLIDIAVKFEVDVEDLIKLNLSKIKTWITPGGREIKGFNAGETIIIPSSKISPKVKKIGKKFSTSFRDSFSIISGEKVEEKAEKIEQPKNYLQIKEGVIVTNEMKEILNKLEYDFWYFDIPVEVISGVRSAQKQLSILVDYAKRHKLHKKYPSILNATVDNIDSWRDAWDELLNVHGVIVNPPIKTWSKLGKRKREVGFSPHMRKKAFDLSGADLDLINDLVLVYKEPNGPIKSTTIEKTGGQWCVHVNIV